jgi:outer membrane autotransporter protein
MPGGSIGTLTVNGNYTQAGTATLGIEVNPTTGSQLRVGGTASIAGGVSVLYDPGTYKATRYAILTAAGGVNGQFSGLTATVSAGARLGALAQSIDYGSNEVDLVLTGQGPTDIGDPLGSPGTSPITGIVVAPTNVSIFAALGTTLVMSAQTANAALLTRLPLDADGLSRSSAWALASASQSRVGGSGPIPGFDAREYGFLAGYDHDVNGTTLGVAAGYHHDDIDESVTGNTGTTDSLHAYVYGGRKAGVVDLSATIGAGLDYLTQKRPFGAFGTAEGDHWGQEASAAVQAAMPMMLGALTLTPRAGVRYAYFHANGFGESGAHGQDLVVGSDTARSLQPFVGLNFTRRFGTELRPVDAEFRVSYARETLGTGRAVSIAAQDGTPFVAQGASLPRDQWTTGVSIEMKPAKALTISLNFDAMLAASHTSAEAASVKMRYRF